MLICTAVLCINFLVPLGLWLALWPLGSGNFGPWQLVTYAFLHGDVLHLFFNMLGLWMFGGELERLWGVRRFVQFYFASVLTAAAAQLVVTALMGSAFPTVGASGGLFGLLLAFGMMFPNRIIMPLFPPIPMKARTFGTRSRPPRKMACTGTFGEDHADSTRLSVPRVTSSLPIAAGSRAMPSPRMAASRTTRLSLARRRAGPSMRSSRDNVTSRQPR